MCTLWSSADRGFSTNGLWKTSPFSSIVSLVSFSSSAWREVGERNGTSEWWYEYQYSIITWALILGMQLPACQWDGTTTICKLLQLSAAIAKHSKVEVLFNAIIHPWNAPPSAPMHSLLLLAVWILHVGLPGIMHWIVKSSSHHVVQLYCKSKLSMLVKSGVLSSGWEGGQRWKDTVQFCAHHTRIE